jgi:hypothetical protein
MITDPKSLTAMWPDRSFPNPDPRKVYFSPEPVPNAPVVLLTQEQLDQVKGLANEAVKFDSGKVDWTLVPFEALEGMVQVLEFGAKKYASWNWTTGGGFKWTRVLASCFRHLFAWARGQDNDPESGLSHIHHAQCNLLFLAYYIGNKEKFNKDDRNVR